MSFCVKVCAQVCDFSSRNFSLAFAKQVWFNRGCRAEVRGVSEMTPEAKR